MANERRPDLLILMTDQLNPTCLGYAGDPVIRTPHIDHLAREGMAFDAHYTICPVCMPARCSFISGLYPHNHGFWQNWVDMRFPTELATMFHDLRAAGYYTAKIGKTHYFNPEWGEDARAYDGYYSELGLDYILEVTGPHATPFVRGAYPDHLASKGLLDAYIKNMARDFAVGGYVVHPNVVAPEDHNDGFIGLKAVEFIEGYAEDRPLCLFVSFPGPHNPMDAPGEYAEMYDPQDIALPPNVPADGARSGGVHYEYEYLRRVRANYYGKITLIDHWIGRIMEAMEGRGRWENTCVAFTADHGDNMGAHGRLAKGSFNDESARVPLILRWPGHIAAGARSAALAELIDVYPTLLDVAGGQVSEGRFGVSLLPVATGQAAGVHEAVFSEIGHPPRLMVRTAQYKWWFAQGQEHLFDMQADPYELHDLADSAAHAPIMREMHEHLWRFFAERQYDKARHYKPLFERAHVKAGAENVADTLYAMFRRLQGLEDGGC